MYWRTSRFRLSLAKPLVMGIVNITPDSFSGVGNAVQARAALSHAEKLLQDGADILDLGAESTRPGASPLALDEEWARLEPVLSEVVQWNVPISVDTYKAPIMQRALDKGADIINDVWALRQTDALETVAKHPACGICLMHMHGEPKTMQNSPMLETGPAFLRNVKNFLVERARALEAFAVESERICIDPGVGFGKTPPQNFSLLASQRKLSALPYPVLVGWSRKSSLGVATGLDAGDRMVPSVVAAILAVQAGARIVRVHDVKETRAGLAIFNAMKEHIHHD